MFEQGLLHTFDIMHELLCFANDYHSAIAHGGCVGGAVNKRVSGPTREAIMRPAHLGQFVYCFHPLYMENLDRNSSGRKGSSP